MKLAIALVVAQMLSAAPPSTCTLDGPYESALCSYQRRDFAAAEKGFRALIASDRPADAQTIRSHYFLARTLMKTGRFGEAATELIRIYTMDPRFYETWNCDFLLGQCRKAEGKG